MRRRVLVLLLLLGVVADVAEVAEVQGSSCPGRSEIVVFSADPAQLEVICHAAASALDYLAGLKLLPKHSITFDLMDEPIVNEGLPAYGRYDSRTDRIELMSYQAIGKHLHQPKMYGEPFDRVHYTGAIAHEVAHAVMQHNLKTRLISPSPQEYLAHATQMAVLPEARRKNILRALAVDPWESGDAISDVYLGIQPDKFAAKSYQHLVSLADPVAFVEVLLNAKWFYVYVP